MTEFTAPFLLLCCIVYAVPEFARRFVRLVLAVKGIDRPPWHRHVWRLLAIGCGAYAGLMLGECSDVFGITEGLGVGCGAGLLSTSAVAAIRKRLKEIGRV